MLIKSKQVVELLKKLKSAQGIEREYAAPSKLSKELRIVQEWQVARLRATYQDLFQHPKYRAAMEFFVTDLYGAKDFGQRDKDFEKVFPLMRSVLPPAAIEVMIESAELHALTQALDGEMARQFTGRSKLNAEGYVRLYVDTGMREERKRQIRSLVSIGRRLEDLVHRPGIGTTIKLATMPAKVLGFGQLHKFIQRGFKAFDQIPAEAKIFNAISLRERFVMEQLFDSVESKKWWGAKAAEQTQTTTVIHHA